MYSCVRFRLSQWVSGSEIKHEKFKGGWVGEEVSKGVEPECIAYAIILASILRQLSLCLEV